MGAQSERKKPIGADQSRSRSRSSSPLDSGHQRSNNKQRPKHQRSRSHDAIDSTTPSRNIRQNTSNQKQKKPSRSISPKPVAKKQSRQGQQPSKSHINNNNAAASTSVALNAKLAAKKKPQGNTKKGPNSPNNSTRSARSLTDRRHQRRNSLDAQRKFKSMRPQQSFGLDEPAQQHRTAPRPRIPKQRSATLVTYEDIGWKHTSPSLEQAPLMPSHKEADEEAFANQENGGDSIPSRKRRNQTQVRPGDASSGTTQSTDALTSSIIQQLNDTKEESGSLLPEDTFSFMIAAGVRTKLFMIGFSVFLLKTTIFALLVSYYYIVLVLLLGKPSTKV